MNIVAKKKIEQAIQEDLRSHISAYQSKRSEQRAELERKIKANPPKEIATFHKQAKDAYATLSKIEETINKKGWRFNHYSSRRFDDKSDVSLYLESTPEIRKFEEETSERVNKLHSLGRSYTLKIYSEKGEIEEVLANFNADIAKLLK